MPREPQRDFASALDALDGPLRYAARHDFTHLHRIKELEPTLAQAARRAAAAAEDPALREELEALAAILSAPTPEAQQRVGRLREVMERVAAVREHLAGKRRIDAEKPPRAAAAARRERAPEERRAEEPAVPAAPARLDAPTQYLKGVGPGLARLLQSRDLHTVEDVLRFLPRRYEDRAVRSAIRELVPGEGGTVEAEVLTKALRVVRGRRMLEVAAGDATGVVRLQWFRVPGAQFAERFEKGRRMRISGVAKLFRGQLQMVHPEVTFLDADAAPAPPSAGESLVPIYLEVENLRPAHLRRIVQAALPAARSMEEALPPELLARHGLPSLAEAVTALHAPPAGTPLEALQRMATPWHQRLIYEELLVLQLVVLRRKAAAAAQAGHAVVPAQPLVDTAAELFPFPLTGAQRRVLAEIEHDLRRDVPMHRLLQGDVGSGKTAVAVTAAAAVARAGLQAAIMAPTELLAEQHARVALKTLPAAGVRVALLSGAVSGAERKRLLAQLAEGWVSVVVGTHAIIQDDVRFKALALGVVDEQHRFGVMQRARLIAQGREGLGATPHMLVMTATPIPRTLALTVYGDLDLSLIDELPPGRTPIRTMLFREQQRQQVYARVRHAVEQGRQAYVVFPLVEESDKEGMESVRAATSAAEELGATLLAGLRLALLHGRMSSDEKDGVMRAFLRREIDVLVATTVIEVGIDVANATVMVIEHAERFGLSQLHQLRGRVGRGAHSSECLLVARFTPSDDAWRRLKIMEQTTDGFRIAEEDLEIRGPGDFVGTRQSGVPLLSIANLARDQKLMLAARQDAAELLARDPRLVEPAHARLRRLLESRWDNRLELAQIG